jgi:lipopolysaccharide/colanic/teichoic acid biosynthesis glycosyltransferase
MLSGKDRETVYRARVLPAKLGIDLDYLSRRTFWSDLRLIFRTILAVFC